MAAPPLPELSSSTARTPWARNSDSITEAPRSLKLPVGETHSHFSSAGAPATARASSGVPPSPKVIGSATAIGRDAR